MGTIPPGHTSLDWPIPTKNVGNSPSYLLSHANKKCWHAPAADETRLSATKSDERLRDRALAPPRKPSKTPAENSAEKSPNYLTYRQTRK